MYSALEIAALVIKVAQKLGQTLTPMQIIKLVYISHGYSLGFDSKALVEDEVKAWKYGPVYPSLYSKLKQYGSREVPANALSGSLDCESDVGQLIEAVLTHYENFDGIDLSALTHQPKTPWDLTVASSGLNTTISNDLIESHYKEIIAKE